MKYVAFDLGASSGKLFEAILDKDRLLLTPIYRFPNQIHSLGEGMYWDFLYIYSQMCRGLQMAEARGRIDSFGIDSFNNDFSLISQDGSMLIPIRSYRDPRTQVHWDKIFSVMPQEQVYRYSGNQIAPFNTLMQLAAMRFSGQQHLLENAHRLLMLPDLLGYYTTGKACMEYTLAAETELLDLSAKCWIPELFQAYQIPAHIFPALHMPGTVLGPSTEAFNQRNKLQGFQFVNVCEHDTASAFLAAPAGEDSLIISSGTWALIGIETEGPIITDFTYRSNLANEGSVEGHHRLLRNVMGSWLLQELRRDYEAHGARYSFPDIIKLAQNAPAFQYPMDPDDPVFYLPGDMVRKVRQVCQKENGAFPQTPGEMFRCVYEALAMKYRYCADLLEEASGQSYTRISILGGGSQDPLSNQMIADACGRTVWAGPADASAIGNILVQMLAHGEIPSIAQGRELIRRSFPIQEYTPRNCSIWDGQYSRYRKIFTGSASGLRAHP